MYIVDLIKFSIYIYYIILYRVIHKVPLVYTNLKKKIVKNNIANFHRVMKISGYIWAADLK